MSVIRRHHYKRLQKTRSNYWFGHETKHTLRESGMVVSTPHPCSCPGGCGNPRTLKGEKTIQEKRIFQKDKY
jgi:hypothetical protein